MQQVTAEKKLSTSVAGESWTPAKRSRMPSVNHMSDRYRERRERNNKASRKCRENRKVCDREMEELAAKLEGENESLKIRMDELEELVKKLREALFEAVVKIGQEASPKMGIDSPRDEQQNKRFYCGSEVSTYSPPGAAHDGWALDDSVARLSRSQPELRLEQPCVPVESVAAAMQEEEGTLSFSQPAHLNDMVLNSCYSAMYTDFQSESSESNKFF
ncbi:hypothetical protein B7P43_G17314 [Cryptotermes secundus]|uniref:BZIP domain-containing protein n=1 Tax=Cryptotermes secundus TaxID=105785 RepID=A0A2J7PFC8_9NEOP|nr:uncharacterized protein LOC111874331 isoform X2 [Cryptotermes secundus]PNF15018.1 hypothetical protein B7P43_G17314 [Cryptotermes secundus]